MKKIFFPLVLITLILLVLLKEGVPVEKLTPIVNVEKTAEPEPGMFLSTQKMNGMWTWNKVSQVSPESFRNYLKEVKQYGVNTIFIYVDEYLSIYEKPDGEEQRILMSEFNENLKNLMKIASEEGIKVHALSGDTSWSGEKYQYLPLLIIDFVKEFNKTNDVKFEAVQFDIEFYNLAEYKENGNRMGIEYLDFLKSLLEDLDGSNIGLGITVPYWFDNENNNAPVIAYDGEKLPIVYHILNILKGGTNYMVVMAYRNYSYGENGTIEISKDELSYASLKTPDVKVIIGQETENVEPKKITFYGKTKDEVISEANKITNAFANYKAFGGIAIHTLDSFRKLE